MTRNRELPQFGILEISKDDIGRYSKIKAMYPDGEITIRWGLDSLTYVNLKSAFSARVFDKIPNLNYEYKLLNIYSSLRNLDKTRDYSGNIKWMSGVKSWEELTHLKWKD